MKLTQLCNLRFAFSLVALSLPVSCVSDGYYGTRLNHSSGSGYATYNTLPSNFSGDAYYYNKRYYSGGRYEPGTYSHRGRTYDHRYFHNGNYFYGGDYRRAASGASSRVTIRRATPSRRITTRRVSY